MFQSCVFIALYLARMEPFFWKGFATPMPSITLLPDGDSIPWPQHSSQADKYLTNTAMTDPIKMRDPVRVLLKRSCLSPKDTRHKPCQYKPAPVQMSVQQWATSLGGGENLLWTLHTSQYVRHHGQSGALLWCVWYLERVRHQCHLLHCCLYIITVPGNGQLCPPYLFPTFFGKYCFE